jgi:hypothetical protein
MNPGLAQRIERLFGKAGPRNRRFYSSCLAERSRGIHSPNFLQPLAEGDGGAVAGSPVGQIGMVASCRQRHVGKWRDETADGEIVRDEGGGAHGHTQAVQRRLKSQVEMVKRQRRDRLQVGRSGRGEPIGPDPLQRGLRMGP